MKHYATREPQKFEQFDAWWFCEDEREYGDISGDPDDDGVQMSRGSNYELMHGADVRVLIKPNVAIDKAVLMLRKLADVLERDIVPQTVGTPESNGDVRIPF